MPATYYIIANISLALILPLLLYFVPFLKAIDKLADKLTGG